MDALSRLGIAVCTALRRQKMAIFALSPATSGFRIAALQLAVCAVSYPHPNGMFSLHDASDDTSWKDCATTKSTLYRSRVTSDESF